MKYIVIYFFFISLFVLSCNDSSSTKNVGDAENPSVNNQEQVDEIQSPADERTEVTANELIERKTYKLTYKLALSEGQIQQVRDILTSVCQEQEGSVDKLYTLEEAKQLWENLLSASTKPILEILNDGQKKKFKRMSEDHS